MEILCRYVSSVHIKKVIIVTLNFTSSVLTKKEQAGVKRVGLDLVCVALKMDLTAEMAVA